MKALLYLPLILAQDPRVSKKTLACKNDPTNASCTQFNILSLSQAGQYGYITARFISYLEQKSYYIAKDYGCDIPDYGDERLAMTEIFDLIAGTDTGAIIAGSIAYKDPSKSNA